MIDIKKSSLFLTLIFLVFGCIEPNTEDLWDINIDSVLQTDGFARDIAIEQNTAFVASGQSGIQVWDLGTFSRSSLFTGYFEGGAFLEFNDLALIGRDEINNLIFISESNKDVMIFNYDGNDTLKYRNTIMSAKTKDFISFTLSTDQFFMYSADNDDGMKWHRYDLDTTNVFGIEFIEWTPYGGDEIATIGKPLGIDSDGVSFIAMAVDQLGVELYTIEAIGENPTLVGRIDTDGNARQVTNASDGVFVSSDEAGAYYIPYSSFNSNAEKYRFAKDLTVSHISVSGETAALSLGAKGIALYDVTSPSNPQEKGIFPVGYAYKSQFWGEKLLVCTREGVQVISIN